MFIRSSTAINDCLIALDIIAAVSKLRLLEISICLKENANMTRPFLFVYESQEARDKAFYELCTFLNSNYKLRDFT
jgi:hypothetical protein